MPGRSFRNIDRALNISSGILHQSEGSLYEAAEWITRSGEKESKQVSTNLLSAIVPSNIDKPSMSGTTSRLPVAKLSKTQI